MNLNKQFTILLASCIALLSMGVSCKDKNKKSYCEENPSQCQSVTTAKEYFLFKIGSWWVYEEETTHERDSMYVIESNSDSGYSFDVRIKSALTEYIYHYWPLYASANPSCSSINPINEKCLFIKESKGKSGDFVGEGYCFFVDFNEGDYLGSFNVDYPNNRVYVADILTELQIVSSNYYSVVKTHELASVLDNNQPKNNYYSKGIGLIRKELLDSNEVWNLVNYHIAA